MKRADVVLVGAGVSALSAAQEFRRAGLTQTVLEKSRGFGGRAATRRIDGVPVDHGAQFFTARSEPFQRQVRDWERQGICFPWSFGFHRSERGRLLPPTDSHPRYACKQGMTAIAKAMSEGVSVERQCKAVDVRREDGGFRIGCEEDRIFWGKRLVLSAPLPQVLELAPDIVPGEGIPDLGQIEYSPCFAVIAEITGPDPEWKGLCADDDRLSWVAADFTKRLSRGGGRYVVLHSSSRYAREHFDRNREEVGRQLAGAAADADASSLQGLIVKGVHRWRFAKAESPPATGRFFGTGDMFIVGDAFGANIEAAWLSGLAAARHITGSR